MKTEEYLKLYLEEIREIPECAPEEEAELVKKLPDERAKARLIEGNLAFTARLAMGYLKQGAEAADLIQEGNIALTEFAGSGEAKEGNFSDGKKQAIQAAMKAFVEEQKQSGKTAQKLSDTMNVMNDVTTELAERFGREATITEVAERMQLPEEEVRILMKAALNVLDSEA